MAERLSSLLRHPLARMLGASLAMFLALATSFAAMEAGLPKHTLAHWPNAVGALACALGYCAHARWVEHRRLTELGGRRALVESAGGVALGGLLAFLTLAPLWALGVYRIDGWGDSARLVDQMPEMVLVAVMEELLLRGVIFRIAEQAWGSRRAFALSTVLFVAAHLPGEISGVGVLVTGAASIAFSAAYQLTGRLWLPIGMHFAWNYLFSAVLSLPVSGHEATGWLRGSLNGSEWLTGGAYGIEASAMALLVWAAASLLLLRRAHPSGLAQAFRTQPRSQR
ncbi:MAG TPA: CPBP family intramembrane glutamic endopeptidase [Caldimonas sp.]|nr:CPBP family intramembrane glutamic endopeptidase [Caldimonas sp.]